MLRTSGLFSTVLLTFGLCATQPGIQRTWKSTKTQVRAITAALVDELRTRSYIDTLDPARFIRIGCDANDPHGSRTAPRDDTREYDFERVEQVRTRLDRVDRPRALAALFARVTAGAPDDTARHRAVSSFLQQALRHERAQPLHRDGTAEFDPLVLLELAEARCGQAARVAVDLFEAAGYRGRLVQAHAHVLAEIHYGDRWHYLDADMFGGGATVLAADGTIPSVAELSRTPYALDALPPNWKLRQGNPMHTGSATYPSFFYFARQAYTTPPVAYVKRGAVAGPQLVPHYGWNYWDTVEYPDRFPTAPVPERLEPAAPLIDELTVGRTVRLGWSSTPQPVSVHGYRVLVSRASRGWGYDRASLAEALLPYKSHPEGWKPEQYAARFRVPPSEVALVTTAEPRAELTLAPGTYYVSVMPFDTHGESVGRVLYPLSEELKITVPELELTCSPRGPRRRSP